MADDCLRQARAVSISCDERMLALLLQQNDKPTDSPAGVTRRSTRASPHLIWGVEDKRGSLYVLDAAARHFTLGRSSKCDVCLDPALGSVSAVHASIYSVSKDKWEIQDKSSSGTLVNSTLLLGSCIVIRDGDSFHLGSARNGATFVLRSLNSDFGYTDWKWKENRHGAVHEAAVEAAANKHKEKAKRKGTKTHKEEAREADKHPAPVHRQLQGGGDGQFQDTVADRLQQGLGKTNSRNVFDDVLARCRDTHILQTLETREADASKVRISKYATGIFGNPEPDRDTTAVPAHLLTQFSRSRGSRSSFSTSAPEIQRVEKGGGGAVAVPLRSVVDYSDNYTTLETRGSDNGSWALERAQAHEGSAPVFSDALHQRALMMQRQQACADSATARGDGAAAGGDEFVKTRLSKRMSK